MVVDAQEDSIDQNSTHDGVVEQLRLDHLKDMKSEIVYRLNWNDLWRSEDQQSLDLDPLLLLFREIVRALPLLDFLVELVNNDRNEEVHNEETCQEDEDDEQQRHCLVVVFLWDHVVSLRIDG
jgi:hypothetical protein